MSYFNRPEVSNSDLSALKRDLYKGWEDEPVEAYRFGTLLDAMVTEPELVDEFKLTVAGEQYAAQDFELARKMRTSFRADPFCQQIHRLSQFQLVMSREMNFEYQGIPFSLPVRCKWDFFIPSGEFGADLKSTAAETQKQFVAACEYFDYDRQRAWYMDIAGSDKDMLIGVSKKNHKIFKLPITRGDAFYTSGREKYLELAFKYWQLFG